MHSPMSRELEQALSALAQNLRPSAGSKLILVWADAPLTQAQHTQLSAARLAGAAVVLLGPSLAQSTPWQAETGVQLGQPTVAHDLRVRPGRDAPAGLISDHGHRGLGHLGEHVHAWDALHPMISVPNTAQVLLTARLGLTEHPVALWCPQVNLLVWTIGGSLATLQSRAHLRLLATAIQRLFGPGEQPSVRIGLLGYGAIGHEHAKAATAVPGLELAAVCDTSEQRRAAAAQFSPGVRTHAKPEDLLADELDLIVVSTPPNSHAQWGLQVVESGRHVVVEKPFAITTTEADAVLAAAAERDLLAVVYQNRRFDPDYLALKSLTTSGALGEVFHLESFVGGFGHPCNLWHSDEEVSGGAFYDWGAHVIDQILDLMPQQVASVTAVAHKKRWLDITNADHSRVTISFNNGAEAEFIYSDLAAALKPRWYVLGSSGAVVGNWRQEKIITRSAVGTLAEDILSPADSPPTLVHHHGDGSSTQIAYPPAPVHPFHLELADFLQLGLPMSVTGAQSRRVLSVMEAARASAASGGAPVVPK